MRRNVLLLAMVCAGALAIGIAAPAPQDQEDVRGAFLTSRPKEKPAGAGTNTKASRRRPKTVAPGSTSKTPEKKPVDPGHKGTTPPSTESKPVNVARLGLGMTLFTRYSNGLAVRADPEHVFRKGDRVRVLLETNSDGYLYIFNTTNDGPVKLIYPDPELDEAGNYVQAHVPFEIPSSTSDEERLRWLVFDEFPGTERLFFVFTREPLKEIPIEDELIALCKQAEGNCPLKPSAELWERIQKQMQEPLARDNNGRFGRAQTGPEQQASTRGLSLAKDDPEPSLIMMASSTSSMLVTMLDLIHK